MDIKLYLQKSQVEDEELFEKLKAAVTNRTGRMQKLSFRHVQSTSRNSAQLVAHMATPNENRTPVEDKTPEKPPKVNLLTEVRGESRTGCYPGRYCGVLGLVESSRDKEAACDRLS